VCAMCGIVGYVGDRPPCDVVVEALRRMEYRGYDSAGVAVVNGFGTLTVRRRGGRLANLEAALNETYPVALSEHSGLGHTRWATHARPTDRNAHSDAAVKIAVVNNGIIGNFATLRSELEAAEVEFASDTDTEVAVHLVARQYQHGDTARDFVASVLAVLRRLEGHFTLVFLNADDPLGQPLLGAAQHQLRPELNSLSSRSRCWKWLSVRIPLRAAMPNTVRKPTIEPNDRMPSPSHTASTPPTRATGSARKAIIVRRRLPNAACRSRRMAINDHELRLQY
jgi:Glutamine amidotransferase domain